MRTYPCPIVTVRGGKYACPIDPFWSVLRYLLENGGELAVCYRMTAAIHRDLVNVATLHDDYVIAVWEPIVAIAIKGRRAIGTE